MKIEFLLGQQNPTRPPSLYPHNAPNAEDQAWVNSNLSTLGAYKPYKWAEGELEQGKPVKYVPGKGFVIDE